MSAEIAAVAAIATVLIAAVTLYASRRWNHAAAKRDEAVTAALREIAGDVEHVRALTEGAIEEGRRREERLAPRPDLVALADGHEVEALHHQLPIRRELAIEELVRRAVEKGDEQGPYVRSSRDILSLPDPFAATRTDVERYDRKLDEYERTIRGQLETLDRYYADVAGLALLRFRIHNHGSVPLEDARVVIRLPDGAVARQSIPHPPELDRPPRWRSRLDVVPLRVNIVDQLQRASGTYDPNLLTSGFTLLNSPQRAEWRAGDVQHGEQCDTPTLILGCEAGEYLLRWEIHADNLSEPERGEIELAVVGNSAVEAIDSLRRVGLEEDDEDEV